MWKICYISSSWALAYIGIHTNHLKTSDDDKDSSLEKYSRCCHPGGRANSVHFKTSCISSPSFAAGDLANSGCDWFLSDTTRNDQDAKLGNDNPCYYFRRRNTSIHSK